jgi:hypothetical protein
VNAGNQSQTEQLVTAFRARTLPKADWTHHAHLRVGLWHVLNYPPDTALARLREGITRLNEAHGTPNTFRSGYHETITQFYVWLIAHFVFQADPNRRRSLDDLGTELIARHGDRNLPLRYYSRELLDSPEARELVVMPDLEPSFESWLEQVFDHPVEDPAWHWNMDFDTQTFRPLPATALSYAQRLFANPEVVATRYTNAQLNQGLWYLVSCSEHLHGLADIQVPVPLRLACVRTIRDLFERLFAAQCSNHLSHLDEPGAAPLNAVCYMWWDLFPSWGTPNDLESAPLDAAILSVMESCLALDSIACQESALHGFGHWHMHYPAFVEQVIDAYVARNRALRPDLLEYSQNARVGYVL